MPPMNLTHFHVMTHNHIATRSAAIRSQIEIRGRAAPNQRNTLSAHRGGRDDRVCNSVEICEPIRRDRIERTFWFLEKVDDAETVKDAASIVSDIEYGRVVTAVQFGLNRSAS
jgi:hypothetical protein